MPDYFGAGRSCLGRCVVGRPIIHDQDRLDVLEDLTNDLSDESPFAIGRNNCQNRLFRGFHHEHSPVMVEGSREPSGRIRITLLVQQVRTLQKGR